ncbi:hypothetical protein KP509_35G007700 [Ceratopteris richardii]|uniref:Uncharacterized protein n=1 Tax=Ceratopteris richardii TaxID=49495 RepID=A0A8T2QE97_CERRI|nr:hypothetical protein KP509_35G007700 [Ceratopteris richardii]
MATLAMESAEVIEKPVFFPEIRDKAIVTFGEECSAKSDELLRGYELPDGLLPLKDVVEGGWVEETGFVWMVLGDAQQHHFAKADRFCYYDELITCTVSPKRMKDIHGVKAKDFGIWVPINEIYIDEKNPETIVFKSIMGLSRSFPVSHFVKDA